jgi:Ca-activated chloride channel family protein
MFRFGFLEALYGLLLVPLLTAFFWLMLRRKQRALERFGETELVRKLSQTVNRRGLLAKRLLLLASVTLLVLALARPQFGTRVETVRREGQDIVVALDVSNSMLAEDIAPNRLENAKLAVARMIDRLDGDRIGLVAFAGEAFVQSPLTTDYAAATLFLGAMEPGLVPVQGTDLGAALAVSLGAFDEREREHRVLIVITDGEDHEGAIDAAVTQAVEAGIGIYTVGIGSPDGVPIPDFDERGRRRGFKRDADGNVVTTKLDEPTLRRIADDSGGGYFRATARGTELYALTDEIAEMGGRQIDAQQLTQFEEQYQIFLGLAIALLFVEFLVPDRRRPAAEWKGRFQ